MAQAREHHVALEVVDLLLLDVLLGAVLLVQVARSESKVDQIDVVLFEDVAILTCYIVEIAIEVQQNIIELEIVKGVASRMNLLKDIEQSDGKGQDGVPGELFLHEGEQLLEVGSIPRHDHVRVQLGAFIGNLELLWSPFDIVLGFIVLDIDEYELSVAQELGNASDCDLGLLFALGSVPSWLLDFLGSCVLHHGDLFAEFVAVDLHLDDQWSLLLVILLTVQVCHSVNDTVLTPSKVVIDPEPFAEDGSLEVVEYDIWVQVVDLVDEGQAVELDIDQGLVLLLLSAVFGLALHFTWR